MPGITVRFSETSYAEIKEEARREGLSTGAYIREAAYARTVLLRARRGEYPEAEGMALKEAVVAFLAAEDRCSSPPAP